MRSQLAIAVALLGAIGIARRRAAVGRDARVPHLRQTAEEYRAAGHRVLIIGAGFGGMTVALELDRHLRRAGRDDVSILVVDRDNAQVFTPLLWIVAGGRANPGNVVVPARAYQRGRAFHLLQAEVEGIDLARREVQTSAGPRPYDTLVIATGSVTAIPGLPGLREHARVFETATDALELRNHLIDAIEMAHRLDDPDERRAWLTFVVGGGGDTGIELAATIHDYLTAGLFAEYPWLADAPPRIVVVGRAARLVPMGTVRTSATVERILEATGIEIQTGVAITGVTASGIETSRGTIPARTLFWAAGIAAPPLVRALPLPQAGNGAIRVDAYLRAPGHEEVFVIGDAAWAVDPATRAGVPPTAQAAEHEGRYVAAAIAAGLAGQPSAPFRFRPRGHLALLGRRTGVAQVGPLTLTGLPAWALWHAYYLARIGTWRNRARLVTDLALAALTGRETGQLRLDPVAAPPPAPPINPVAAGSRDGAAATPRAAPDDGQLPARIGTFALGDGPTHERAVPTLSQARERLRIARTVRDAARQRGETQVADLEEATIAKMERRLAELEALADGEQQPGW